MSPIPLGKYIHYKDPSKQYEVIAVGRLKTTLELMVIYQALYDTPDFGPRPVWVRPLPNFTEMVEVNGKQVPRFVHVNPQHG